MRNGQIRSNLKRILRGRALALARQRGMPWFVVAVAILDARNWTVTTIAIAVDVKGKILRSGSVFIPQWAEASVRAILALNTVAQERLIGGAVDSGRTFGVGLSAESTQQADLTAFAKELVALILDPQSSVLG